MQDAGVFVREMVVEKEGGELRRQSEKIQYNFYFFARSDQATLPSLCLQTPPYPSHSPFFSSLFVHQPIRESCWRRSIPFVVWRRPSSRLPWPLVYDFWRHRQQKQDKVTRTMLPKRGNSSTTTALPSPDLSSRAKLSPQFSAHPSFTAR